MKNPELRSAFRVSFLYLLLAGLWILVSDQLLAQLTDSTYVSAQTLKGMFFILVTSILLFGLLKNEWKRYKRATQALQYTDEQYRRIVETTHEGIWTIDVNDVTTFVNKAMARMLGYSVDEMLHQPLFAFVYVEDRPKATAHLARQRQGVSEQFEFRFQRKDGSPLWVNLSASPLLDLEGQYMGALAMINDISERKSTEEALQESEAQFRAAFEGAAIGMALLNLAGDILQTNQTLQTMLGYREAELQGLTFTQISHPDDNTRSLQQYRELVAGTREQYQVEQRYIHKEGYAVDCHVAVSLVRDAQGNPDFVIAMMEDITQRKRAEQAELEQRTLAEALRDIAATLASTLDFDVVMKHLLDHVGRVVTHDAANIMLIENEHARIIYHRGYSPAHIDFLQGFRFPLQVASNLGRVLQTGAPVLVSDTAAFPEWIDYPETRWIRSHIAVPIRSRDRIIGFLNLDSKTPGFFAEEHVQRLQAFADQAAIALENAQLYREVQEHALIMEQRVQERTAELYQAKEHVETILNSTTDVIVITDERGIVSQTNSIIQKVFQYSPEELPGQPLTVLVNSESASPLQETLLDVVEIREAKRLEVVCLGKEGNPFDAEIVLSPIVMPTGEAVTGVVCSLRDITVRNEMVRTLRLTLEREMELNELKSRFVSIASHEFRNPLAVIQTALDILTLYGDRLSREQQQRKFAQIRANIRALSELLDDILTISRAEAGKLSFEPDLLDVETLCREAISEVRTIVGTTHTIAFSNIGNCTEAVVDRRLLRHIINNLLSNAIKYSAEGTTVTFTLDCDGNRVIFRVADKGIGIPEEDQRHLFEAFYRAGNVGDTPGTGLGLAIVKQAVEAHGGEIHFESRENIGTTFTVVIPSLPDSS